MMNNNNNKYIQMEKKGKEASRFARKANDSSGGSSLTICAPFLPGWVFFFKKSFKTLHSIAARENPKKSYTQSNVYNKRNERTRKKKKQGTNDCI
jgi:hypothetical protein